MKRIVGALALVGVTLAVGACAGGDNEGALVTCWREVAGDYRQAADRARPILSNDLDNLGARYGVFNQAEHADDASNLRRGLYGLVQGLDQMRGPIDEFAALRRRAEATRATCRARQEPDPSDCWKRAADLYRPAVTRAHTILSKGFEPIRRAVENIVTAQNRTRPCVDEILVAAAGGLA
jgi:hypothetical protein